MLFGWSDGLAVDFGALGKVNLGGGAVAVLWFLHICCRGWWLLQSPLLGMFLCGWAVMVVFCVSAGVEKWLWLRDCRALKPFVMDNETQPKQEPLLKAGIVEENLQAEKVEPNQEPLKAEILEEDRLPKERVELDLQPLEAERVEEDKLPKEKVELDQELLMEGEIVEEDELPKENVEFQEPLEGEIVVVAQEPSKIDLFEEDKLPKEEVELDEEALKFLMLDYELLKLELEYDNYLDTLYLEELLG
ncbi:hypothetical protein Patl1_35990 [Pistacia atlantica]|nr:hypothetical protein Patl1_35990 [Pistacia atlantica]